MLRRTMLALRRSSNGLFLEVAYHDRPFPARNRRPRKSAFGAFFGLWGSL
jgi:hypothetical protein